MNAPSTLVVIAVLAGVLALVGVATWLFKLGMWRSQPRPGRTLILRESIALDPRRRVHIVQCGQRQVVLMTGGGQDVVVGWMQDP
jgi:flagellar protein FliO/FliZ